MYFKKKILLALVIVFAQCLLIHGCSSSPNLKNVLIKDQLAKPEEMQNIKIIRDGKIIPPEFEIGLKKGDQIKTDGQSRAVISLSNDIELILGYDTQVTLTEPNQRIYLASGNIFSRIKKALKNIFKIETEYITAGVEGTEFQVITDENDHVSVTVLEGSVWLDSNTQSWQTLVLTKNQNGTFLKGENPQIKNASQEDLEKILGWINEVDKTANVYAYIEDQGTMFSDVGNYIRSELSKYGFITVDGKPLTQENDNGIVISYKENWSSGQEKSLLGLHIKFTDLKTGQIIGTGNYDVSGSWNYHTSHWRSENVRIIPHPQSMASFKQNDMMSLDDCCLESDQNGLPNEQTVVCEIIQLILECSWFQYCTENGVVQPCN